MRTNRVPGCSAPPPAARPLLLTRQLSARLGGGEFSRSQNGIFSAVLDKRFSGIEAFLRFEMRDRIAVAETVLKWSKAVESGRETDCAVGGNRYDIAISAKGVTIDVVPDDDQQPCMGPYALPDFNALLQAWIDFVRAAREGTPRFPVAPN